MSDRNPPFLVDYKAKGEPLIFSILRDISERYKKEFNSTEIQTDYVKPDVKTVVITKDEEVESAVKYGNYEKQLLELQYQQQIREKDIELSYSQKEIERLKQNENTLKSMLKDAEEKLITFKLKTGDLTEYKSKILIQEKRINDYIHSEKDYQNRIKDYERQIKELISKSRIQIPSYNQNTIFSTNQISPNNNNNNNIVLNRYENEILQYKNSEAEYQLRIADNEKLIGELKQSEQNNIVLLKKYEMDIKELKNTCSLQHIDQIYKLNEEIKQLKTIETKYLLEMNNYQKQISDLRKENEKLSQQYSKAKISFDNKIKELIKKLDSSQVLVQADLFPPSIYQSNPDIYNV